MKTIIRTLFASSAVLVMLGCSSGTENAADKTVENEVPSVSITQAVKRNVDHTHTYTSTVQPYIKNNIAPQSMNRISKINVEIGDFVTKGQVLAEMDQIQLRQAELQMKNYETEYNRLQELFDAGGLSQSDLDAIELAYNVSKSSYENLLENSVLTSPISGIVTARNYDAGDMYGMTLPLFTVEQIVPVKLLIGVSETDYSKIRKGAPVSITVDALPGKTFTGKVNRVYPSIDPMTRTVTVETVVNNSDKVLRPGMFARVTLNFETVESIIIPDTAVIKQTGSGERFVYILNPDNTVTYKKVELGLRLDNEYEVLSGVAEGDKVVTGGQIRLKDGIKVTIN